ncbi:MAG: hypothetical protein KC502_08825 [Myxococcales bacterium]|nr:hypothetical protein [Myxococcales bacterium]
MKLSHWMSLALCLALCACGSDDKEPADSKSGNDASATDAASTDDSAGGDGAGGTCGELPSCLDSNNVEDLGLCPKPVNEYACVSGCCEKKEVCKADSDCADKLGGALCPDKRFTCGCDTSTGACVQTVCAVDGDCGKDQVCIGGGCSAPPKASDLTAHLMRPYWLARPGDTADAATALGAQARSAGGLVDPNAKFTWTLKGDGFKLADGKLTAADKAGKATITAVVAGGKASAPATLWNLGPVKSGDNLRVVVVDEETAAPIKGKVVIVGLADQATPDKAQTADLDTGTASFKDIKWPADIHVIADGYDTVSVLRYKADKAGDLVISTRIQHYAKLAFDDKGKSIKDKSELIHGDVITGGITYSGQGEAALGITSVGVGSDLLLFNLDAVIGPSVERPFDETAPNLVNPNPGEPQDIPGGVSFFLGAPVVSSYMIAAPPGKRVMWSLSGKLGLNELLSQVSAIVAAVDDGLDVGKVVGVLLPYLSGFYSQVVMDVPFADTNAVASKVTEKQLAPDIPLGLYATVKPPVLPVVKEGQWADLMLILAGAMLPNGQLIPLGLSAGSDTSEKTDKPDGVVDGDQETPGNQDVELTYAPLHSGLRVGPSNYIVVTAAINVGGKGKKEGGSIVFSKVGPLAETISPEAFLPYAKTSSYDPKSRVVTISKVDAAHFYRVVMTGAKAQRWQVLLPKTVADKGITLPDLTTWGAKTDLGKAPKRALIGAFELRAARSFVELFKPDGLLDLVRLVKRTSFLDVH